MDNAVKGVEAGAQSDMQALGKALEKLVVQLSKPKKVVRGKDGRVETIQ